MDVRTLSLGVLSRGAMTGYEIRKYLDANFRHVVSAGYGSIYPALAELTGEGLVTVTSVEQERRPDKKIYAITEAGRARLVADLVATAPRHRVRSEFLILMCFADLLPREKVEESLDAMMRQWERWLYEDLERCEREEGGVTATPGMQFAVGYGRAVLTAALGYVRRQRRTLLDALEAQAVAKAAAVPAERQAAE